MTQDCIGVAGMLLLLLLVLVLDLNQVFLTLAAVVAVMLTHLVGNLVILLMPLRLGRHCHHMVDSLVA
jgi:hypothetical protein